MEKLKPKVSETLVRGQFFRSVMTEGQTSRDFLQQLWQGIRRTSCTNREEQLQWVLTCFTTRHINPAVVKKFELKTPTTEEEAINMADDVESKIKEKTAQEKVNVVLQAAANGDTHAEVAFVGNRYRGNKRGYRGGFRGNPQGRGGTNYRNAGGSACNNCGSNCKQGYCPAANAQCYECSRSGHYGRMCPERLRRAANPTSGHNNRGYNRGHNQGGRPQYLRRQTNECESAGPGYGERAEQAKFTNEGNQAPKYSENEEVGVQGYQPNYDPIETIDRYDQIQANQLAYLASRASHGHNYQRVPKASSSQEILAIQPRFEPSAVEYQAVSSPFINNCDHDSWRETVVINRCRGRVKIDTGAKVNVMSKRHFLALGLKPSQLRYSHITLIAFNRALVQPIGCFLINVQVRDRVVPMVFQVVEACANVLICYRDAVRSGLISSVSCDNCGDVTAEAIDVDEFNVYKNEVLSLKLKDNAIPKAFQARTVPQAHEQEVKTELERMVDEGIIVPVTEATAWASPMLVRRKPNGKLRVCMDPRYLNTFLIRAVYPMPNIETVFPKVIGATWFSKLDMTQGFWHIQLDEESSHLCTFSTPYGRYRYLRMPFGLSPAPEVFHRMVGDVIRDIQGVTHFVDDVLIWGKTQTEHDQRLREVLNKLEKAGFAINKDKCDLSKNEVMFLGHRINGTYIRPNPVKVDIVKNFPPPTNVEELRRLLGVATYISKFIPRFSTLTEPLRRLLQDGVAFCWEDEQQRALNDIKDALKGEKVLFIFNPQLPVQIATDASGTGLGAVLLQHNRPVSYAARSVTKSEHNYSPIEKELLAVVFALKRFHFYTAGRQVEILTDHQPLRGAAKNVLTRDNDRLDRLFDQIMSYDLIWTYIPGKTNYLPDYLSRLPPTAMPVNETDTTVQKHEGPIARGPVYESIAKTSETDPIVTFVKDSINNGWPPGRALMPENVKFLWPMAHQLRISHGVVADINNRAYVPASVRPVVLQELHIGHPGIYSMLRRAKKWFFWPTMTNDVIKYVDECERCGLVRARQNSEPLLPRAMPKAPGEVIAADFFELKKKKYLVFYDVFSQFPMLWPVNSESVTALIKGCAVFFQFTGCPAKFWSDRGGAFDSHEFRRFAAEIGMDVKFSSAEYPQSNGAAESAVKILKRLKSVSLNETEFLKAVIYLQNTTKAGHSFSPAEVFLGRSVRTPLQELAKKAVVSWTTVYQERKQDQSRMKHSYDRTASKPCLSFKQGDRVLVHNVKGKSVTATVVEQATTPRAYTVRLDSGTSTTRNQKFLTVLPRTDMTATTGNQLVKKMKIPKDVVRIPRIPPAPPNHVTQERRDCPVITITKSGRRVYPTLRGRGD